LLADLSPAARVAAETVLERNGLRLEGIATAAGGKVEKRYIQDIFRQWLAAGGQ
jgi:hypothetical protein